MFNLRRKTSLGHHMLWSRTRRTYRRLAEKWFRRTKFITAEM